MREDICCVIDADTQKVVQNFHYSAYGEQDTKSILSWGFSSKRYDPETGFIYFGRRYYAPFIGRWITADPLGYADGPNLYAYVHNNPLTHFDLYGLAAFSGSSQLREYQFSLASSREQWSGYYSNVGPNQFRNESMRLRTTDRRDTGYAKYMRDVYNGFRNNTFVRGVSVGSKIRELETFDHFYRNKKNLGILHNFGTLLGGTIGFLEGNLERFSNLTDNKLEGTRCELPTVNNISQLLKFSDKVQKLVRGSRNRFVPNASAIGEHTVFRTDLGRITHYETYRPQTNPRDPKLWESVKRYDRKGVGHTNKVLQTKIETPHVHDPLYPGEIRYPQDWEMPL